MKKKRGSPGNKNSSADAGHTSRGRSEKDMDEQVHSGEVEMAGESDHEDPDDKVHRLNRKKTGQLKAEDHPEDPDDLVHENDEEDDD